MEALGSIGMSMGTMGFIFSIIVLNRISVVEKQLKEAGVINTENEPVEE